MIKNAFDDFRKKKLYNQNNDEEQLFSLKSNKQSIPIIKWGIGHFIK